MSSITNAINETRESLSSVSESVDAWFDKEERLRAYKPSNGGWSINEVLEHIALTNHYLLILVRKGMTKALKASKMNSNIPADYQLHTKELEEVGSHGSFKWVRPEHMEPKGERPPDDIRKEFHEQLKECHTALDAMPHGEGTLYKTTMTVNNLGKIDVYQYIYFLAMHAKRHIEQMEKVEKEWLDNKSAKIK